MSEKPTTSIAPDEDDAPHFTREMAQRGEHAVGTHVLKQADPPLGSRRGRPALAKGERKQQVTLRLSPEVLEYFRSTGEGWQTRIDEALQAHIAAASLRSRWEAPVFLGNIHLISDEHDVEFEGNVSEGMKLYRAGAEGVAAGGSKYDRIARITLRDAEGRMHDVEISEFGEIARGAAPSTTRKGRRSRSGEFVTTTGQLGSRAPKKRDT